MVKLLYAGFARLRQSKFFYLLLLIAAGFGFCILYEAYSDMINYGDAIVDIGQLMLHYGMITGIIIALFTSLFLSVEYSDGVIRNKIAIGHKRTDIYLSNQLVTVITILLSYLAYVAVIICVGIPLLGTIKMPIGQWLGLFGCLLIAVLAYCAIFTFIGMLISNRAISTIVSILLAFGLLFAAMACFEVVEAPEFVWTISMVEGEMIESRIPNPNYPGDAERMVCQILFSINPAGQMYQLSGIENPEMTALPLYSLGIITFFTFSGIGLFKRKDLK